MLAHPGFFIAQGSQPAAHNGAAAGERWGGPRTGGVKNGAQKRASEGNFLIAGPTLCEQVRFIGIVFSHVPDRNQSTAAIPLLQSLPSETSEIFRQGGGRSQRRRARMDFAGIEPVVRLETIARLLEVARSLSGRDP